MLVKAIASPLDSLLVSTLQKYDFEQLAADPCVFELKRQNQVILIMSVNVLIDDVLLGGKRSTTEQFSNS